jgi:G3E family GTPase
MCCLSSNAVQSNEESLIVIVGFLGAGKTTLLKRLIADALQQDWNPYVILNDYENATIDAQQIAADYSANWIQPLSGSCICCSGLTQLRESVNRIPERENGITLIEANGTTDACTLLEFLGVGIDDRFSPPVQIAVVDVQNWQTRGEHNVLEASQIQVSSLIVLSHLSGVAPERYALVQKQLQRLNPVAKILDDTELAPSDLLDLAPSRRQSGKLDHSSTHWSSCSVDLPVLPGKSHIHRICARIPASILRVKGCAEIDREAGYTYFERAPDGEISIRPFNGVPITGTKLLTIGPQSTPQVLREAVEGALTETRLATSQAPLN